MPCVKMDAADVNAAFEIRQVTGDYAITHDIGRHIFDDAGTEYETTLCRNINHDGVPNAKFVSEEDGQVYVWLLRKVRAGDILFTDCESAQGRSWSELEQVECFREYALPMAECIAR
jgi:hypothetical protein